MKYANAESLALLRFMSSHCQFYICDEDSPKATDSDNFWTDEAHTSRLAVEEGIIGIGTESYTCIKAEISILTQCPDGIDLEEYDHVVEASLKISSGIIQVLNCPDSTIEFEKRVVPGDYRVQARSLGLESVKDEFEEADDRYLILIWSEAYSPRKVVKQYTF
ncbi:MAG: hypothetical protein EOO58_02440 [Hymenobacter sp.]|nr:MAG: hypothetical protein EOO58_02440 [Hymenobacter sp.]